MDSETSSEVDSSPSDEDSLVEESIGSTSSSDESSEESTSEDGYNSSSSEDSETGSYDYDSSDSSDSESFSTASSGLEASHEDHELKTPLYDGADVSVLDSYLLIYQFALKHGLSKVALDELIRLLTTHLPRSSKAATSLHTLEKYFAQRLEITTEVHRYCDTCHRLVEAESDWCESGCQSTIRTFVVVPIDLQLKKKLEDPGIWNLIQQRFTRRSAAANFVSDIWDGEEYRKHHQFLSNPANVSLLLNTDGVSIFRSSKCSLWPIWLVINELPPSQRFSKRNMLLGGLWFDSEKPTMTTFLFHILMSINSLYSRGITVNSPQGTVTCRAVLLLACVDLPAQAKMINMKGHNGKYACAHCEDEGVPRASCHLHRDWPYQINRLPRTHGSMTQNARDTLSSPSAVKGIKGASIFCVHKPFDLSKGFAIDDLHVLFLGITGNLLNYWFGDSHKRKPFSIANKIKECDSRLLKICVPDIISRTPRSLTDHAHWKGSQLRSWLLYFSLPVLHGILQEPYFSHFCYLVAGVHIVMSDAISSTDLSNAQLFFEKFYSEMSTLYGSSSNTMKVHLLRHISQCVKNWGPVWAYSCFSFESMNHHIKSLFHGSRDMSQTLAFNHLVTQSLPNIIALRCCTGRDRVQLLMERLSRKKGSHFNIELKDCIALGQSCHVSPSVLELQELNRHFEFSLQVHREKLLVYQRILVDKPVQTILFSEAYTRVKLRNSFTVQYSMYGVQRFGKILYFVHINEKTYAMLRTLVSGDESLQHHFHSTNDCLDKIPMDYGLAVVKKGPVQCIPISQIRRKCVFIVVDDIQYVAIVPNYKYDD